MNGGLVSQRKSLSLRSLLQKKLPLFLVASLLPYHYYTDELTFYLFDRILKVTVLSVCFACHKVLRVLRVDYTLQY